MWAYNNSYELYHHGILGQKWGVRRYQNKDGSLTSAGRKRYRAISEDVVLRKGTSFSRIANPESAKFKKNVYVSYRNNDVETYKGLYSFKKALLDYSRTGEAFVNQLSMSADKDIKVAGLETTLSEFKHFYTDNKEDVDNMIRTFKEKGLGRKKSDKEVEAILNRENTGNELDLYKLFNQAHTLRSDKEGQKTTRKFQRQLQKKGYYAITDLNDLENSSYKTEHPIQLFDTSAMKIKVKDLTANDVVNSASSQLLPYLGRTLKSINARSGNEDTTKSKTSRKKYHIDDSFSVSNMADSALKGYSFKDMEKISYEMSKGKTYDKAVKSAKVRRNPLLAKAMRVYIR